MKIKKFYYLMLLMNTILIIIIGTGVYFANQLIQKQASKLQIAKSESISLNDQQTSLLQAKKDIEKYEDLNKIAQSVVPQDKDQAKTILEINKIAKDNGIYLKNITFQSSNLGQSTTNTNTTSNSSTTDSKTTTPSIPASQLKPVDGIKGVYALEINISSSSTQTIGYKELINFLQKLENNRRTAHVAKLNIKPSNDGTISFTITLNAYVKP